MHRANSRSRHPELRQLPSLVPADVRNETGWAVDSELLQRIDRLKGIIQSGVLPDSDSSDDTIVTTCPFVFQAQLHPSVISQTLMDEVEEEMNRPTGITTVKPPPLLMDAVLVSPECGILLHIDSAEGLKYVVVPLKATALTRADRKGTGARRQRVRTHASATHRTLTGLQMLASQRSRISPCWSPSCARWAVARRQPCCRASGGGRSSFRHAWTPSPSLPT